MKFFYNLSKLKDSKTFKHDAPLISGVQIGMIVFLVISSLTVFSGVCSHLTEHLENSFFLGRFGAYIAMYVFASFAPDYINTILCAYLVSALLRKDFSKESKILLVFCSILIIGLTRYSYSMSQNSAVVIGDDIEESNTTDNTVAVASIDHSLSQKIAGIEATYSSNYEIINTPFEKTITNIETTYNNQVLVIQSQIEAITKNETKDNYLYAAKQKKPLADKIQKLESEKLLALNPVLSDQQAAIRQLTDKKDQQVKDASAFHKSDRTRNTSKTDKKNSQVEKTSSTFTALFSKLSGYSVFVLLILTAIRGILFHRNEIEPKPILSNFDFSSSWLAEVFAFPFVWVRNHSVNKVRGWYEQLPELKQPIAESEIFDGQSIKQQIVEPEDDEEEQQAPAASRAPKNLRSVGTITAQVPIAATSGGTHEEKVISRYSHETMKNSGLDSHEIAGTPDGGNSHEKTIKHVGTNNKEYYYNKDQVNGKIKKYSSNVKTWTKKANRTSATKRDKEALANNQEKLEYWQRRFLEF